MENKIDIDVSDRDYRYQLFRAEVDKLWKKEGIDWIKEKTVDKIQKEELKELQSTKTFEAWEAKHKDVRLFLLKFQNLFRSSYNNKDIFFDFIWTIVPRSIREMILEIQKYKENNTWEDFQALTGIRRQHAEAWIKCQFNPKREGVLTLYKSGIISEQTHRNLCLELYGIEQEIIVAPSSPNLSDRQKIESIFHLIHSVDNCSLLAIAAKDILELYTSKCLNLNLDINSEEEE